MEGVTLPIRHRDPEYLSPRMLPRGFPTALQALQEQGPLSAPTLPASLSLGDSSPLSASVHLRRWADYTPTQTPTVRGRPLVGSPLSPDSKDAQPGFLYPATPTQSVGVHSFWGRTRLQPVGSINGTGTASASTPMMVEFAPPVGMMASVPASSSSPMTVEATTLETMPPYSFECEDGDCPELQGHMGRLLLGEALTDELRGETPPSGAGSTLRVKNTFIDLKEDPEDDQDKEIEKGSQTCPVIRFRAPQKVVMSSASISEESSPRRPISMPATVMPKVAAPMHMAARVLPTAGFPSATMSGYQPSLAPAPPAAIGSPAVVVPQSSGMTFQVSSSHAHQPYSKLPCGVSTAQVEPAKISSTEAPAPALPQQEREFPAPTMTSGQHVCTARVAQVGSHTGPSTVSVIQQAPIPPQPIMPLGVRKPQPSVGAALHGTGNCKPCAWFWKPQGCANAQNCQHCHLCPEGELKIRKKAKVAALRAVGGEEDSQVGQTPVPPAH